MPQQRMRIEEINGRTVYAYECKYDPPHWVGYVQIHPEDLLCAIPYDNEMILPKEVASDLDLECRKMSLASLLQITFADWSANMYWAHEVESSWYVGFDFMGQDEEVQNVDTAWAECLGLLKRIEKFEATF